ncbi:hypothetical protein T05_1004 [Trichinella murrelli]|uniref:Uncharacterized protein n=1 Tax=Trichinella murrelli TaxID=144512 RepID=A0A0V0TBT7_9BILA|nr:hypothetical protein T05_1004 [Trichinella murrelli]
MNTSSSCRTTCALTCVQEASQQFTDYILDESSAETVQSLDDQFSSHALQILLNVKVLENAKQNFTTHPITRRTFSQLETLAHRLDEFLNEYLPKAAGKEDMIVCHVFALLADVERFQHSPPGM